MSSEGSFKMFGTCDICHKEVIVQDCFRLGYDRLYWSAACGFRVLMRFTTAGYARGLYRPIVSV